MSPLHPAPNPSTPSPHLHFRVPAPRFYVNLPQVVIPSKREQGCRHGRRAGLVVWAPVIAAASWDSPSFRRRPTARAECRFASRPPVWVDIDKWCSQAG